MLYNILFQIAIPKNPLFQAFFNFLIPIRTYKGIYVSNKLVTQPAYIDFSGSPLLLTYILILTKKDGFMPSFCAFSFSFRLFKLWTNVKPLCRSSAKYLDLPCCLIAYSYYSTQKYLCQRGYSFIFRITPS